MPKQPNPIDVQVGEKIRMRRRLLGISQETLGTALGVTFQQVQKYEKGTNRVSASRLQNVAEILGVSPSYFFSGEGEPGDRESASATEIADFVSSREGLDLNIAYSRIGSRALRRRILGLVTALADGTADVGNEMP
ncbi:transcriptional regulator with XRE-family HTH domain [Rhizobium subbaraonis]|uniref:Transcriptional regulator with XRE-family HTH domain n=1 Tax=Rhizobium subbaraonis TaxID=908946 RepID=A0A285USJ4_9HYPH|nr:helix-turn-helix transcriptional regulator [Rhizobium subbaraonis]SOC44667.1 transcriptional regulator with XRE-family HTH domain [Rhizobium subbaraonis]